MEFHVKFPAPVPDPGRIEAIVRAVDPSALADIDPASSSLRIATSIGARELIELLVGAGHRVLPEQVRQLPSICCGGCRG
jgi:ribosomal protein L32E